MHRISAPRLGASTWIAIAIAAGVPTAASPHDGGSQLELKTDFGPLTLHVNWDAGILEGDYPKYQGRVFGRLADSGRSMRGIWVQPKGDHECKSERYGTTAWGHFVFTYGGRPGPGAQMAGSWGYCDEDPHRPWNGTVTD
jgi:hypothetical protein